MAGKHVPGICDRCGQRYNLKDLRREYKMGKQSGFLVCASCWDAEHPQEPRRRPLAIDAQRVKEPRPDRATAASRSMAGWSPVGNSALILIGHVGKAWVS